MTTNDTTDLTPAQERLVSLAEISAQQHAAAFARIVTAAGDATRAMAPLVPIIDRVLREAEREGVRNAP